MDFYDLKRVLIGEPFPTSRDIHERLDKVRALAVFASDPISSNAYATEAIMSVLILMGSGALSLTLPLGLAVAGLVLLVIFSYIQTILHYPDGGGAYTVAKDNLGTLPSLFAGAALLTDYILTVSVSVSAGVRAVTSAFPETFDYRLIIALIAIALITWINLRGVRESGTIFAVPTYAFVVGVWVVLIIGLVRYWGLFGAAPIPVVVEQAPAAVSVAGFAYVWLLLRAFSGGCTALTGIEAISNGVKAFKPPEAKNAAKTMVAMGFMAMTLFIGITFLSTHISLIPHEGESILSQMTRRVTGGGFLYYWVQLFTALILFLAANTGYQDFPRLSSFLAHDQFLPRWLQNRGDRLVYSSGIVVLATLASLLVIVFQADEIAMLPLYALGVMLSFSLSQAGMFHLMRRIAHLKPGESLETNVTTIHYERNANRKRALNAVGAVVTFAVFLILLSTKFREGAWIVAILIPLLVTAFLAIHRHYDRVAAALSTTGLKEEQLVDVANVVIVPIADVHRGTLRALQYAKRLATDVRALSITTSEAERERLLQRWQRFEHITGDIQLVTIDYDYRDILRPLIDYIEKVNTVEFPDLLTTVVVPEFVPEHMVAEALHNQTASRLRARLKHHQDIVLIEVPYQIESRVLGQDASGGVEPVDHADPSSPQTGE
ncbi:MAG: APC family permease [Chloroflexota bacterium]|nr:MAG: APC family permease [Chloroflexota bacterium]